MYLSIIVERDKPCKLCLLRRSKAKKSSSVSLACSACCSVMVILNPLHNFTKNFIYSFYFIITFYENEKI